MKIARRICFAIVAGFNAWSIAAVALSQGEWHVAVGLALMCAVLWLALGAFVVLSRGELLHD